MARNWYVGTTKDQQETRAAAELRNQGYIAYLPKIHYRHQDGRKIEARTTLRFTGYIFICCEPTEIGPISGTRGMDDSGGSALLGEWIGEGMDRRRRAIPIPALVIETLRAMEDDEYERAVARAKPRPRTDLNRGDEVEIHNPKDAFHGKRAQYLYSVRGMATVLVGMLPKEIAESDLKKIDLPEHKKAA